MVHIKSWSILISYQISLSSPIVSVVHGVDNEKEEEKEETSRLDQFGDWLDKDQEELPEEFRLNVER